MFLGKDGSAQDTFWCDRLDKRTDVCILRGDVHVLTGNSSSVVLYSRICENLSSCARVQMIRPYTRKWEQQTMSSVQPVALECDIHESRERSLSPNGESSVDTHAFCDAIHFVPAVLFSSAGFTGNPYHDFQDVLIPLFIASQHLRGEVVFVVNDMRDWWVERWSKVLNQLTHYPVIDLKLDSGHHCFPEVMAGLYIHKELGVSPFMMPNGERTEDFQRLLYDALASPKLKQDTPGGFTTRLQTHVSILPKQESRQPTLLLVARKETRVLINQDEVVELARKLRFDVKVVTISDKVNIETIYGYV
jgi:hypothetical protein